MAYEHLSFSMHPFIISAFGVLGLGLLVGLATVIYKIIKFKIKSEIRQSAFKKKRPVIVREFTGDC